MAEPFTEDDFTSDLVKAGAWDLWVVDHRREAPLKLLDTLPELFEFLQVTNDQSPRAKRAALREFMALPVAGPAMPPNLRRRVEQYLA